MQTIYGIGLYVLLLIQQPLIEMTMVDGFCQALIANDRYSLKNIFNKKLASLDAGIDRDKQFEILKAWIEEYSCVDSVEIVPGVLRTEPPIKELNVFVHNSDHELVPRNIGIFIYPDKLRFVYR